VVQSGANGGHFSTRAGGYPSRRKPPDFGPIMAEPVRGSGTPSGTRKINFAKRFVICKIPLFLWNKNKNDMTQTETKEKNQSKAAGYTAKKLHWQNHNLHGVMSACRRRLSFSGEGNKEFFSILKNYPEMACEKCAQKFRERVKFMIEKQSK
jgi:hypothetical protein